MYTIIEITGAISESENNRKKKGRKKEKDFYNFHKKVFEFRFQFGNRF